MASVTLAEASKLGLNDLQAGVVENIVTVNPFYQVLPFQEIYGNALGYNRENALGDVQVLGIDGTITAKAAATYTPKTAGLTTIIGDAEVNGLIVAQGIGGNAGNDVVAQQIASKAKSVGREFQRQLILGDTANANEFDGLAKLVASTQKVDANANALTLTMLDELLAAVTSKNGQVDYITMHSKGINKLKALLRALGGAQIDYVQMGMGVDGRPNMVLMYDGVPVFRNDYIPVNGGAGTNESAIYAGVFDDGTGVGLTGLTAANGAGIQVQAVGAAEAKDSEIWRVKFYTGLVSYSDLGLAAITEVTF